MCSTASASGTTLKPMTTAFDAEASVMSDSLMAPTPVWMTLTTTSSFESEEQADAYFRFADAMGKLNVYMNPGVVTPLARMVANRKFMQESLFPKKVVSEIYPKGKTIFTKTFQVENEASLSRRLSERDRSRINRAIHFFAQFPYVSFKTYFEKTSER